jgi:hypothetical protein
MNENGLVQAIQHIEQAVQSLSSSRYGAPGGWSGQGARLVSDARRTTPWARGFDQEERPHG